MRIDSLRKRHVCAAAISILLAGLGTAARCEELPAYMGPIAGRTASSAASIATKNVLALNASMFQLYADAGAVFKQNLLAKHPLILALFSGAGGRFNPVSPGHGAARSAVHAHRVPAAEVGWTQHDGAGRDRDALSGQCVRSILARFLARLPKPNAVGPGWVECDGHAGGVASEQPRHSAE
jgi:hypothetical protein